MDKQKNKARKSKSRSIRPPVTCSMYDFPNRAPYLPPTPGYFPYMLSPWSMDVYMDLVRRLSEERGLRPGQPPDGWGSCAGRGKRRPSGTPGDGMGHPATSDPRPFGLYGPPFYQPQLYQPQEQIYREYCWWDQRLDEESSTSSETLTPCNSCRCCRYFTESRSVIDIVGRERCGRKYVNGQRMSRDCEDGRKCGDNWGHAELPVGERVKSKDAKQGGKARRQLDEDVLSEPERDAGRASDENSNSSHELRDEFRGEFRGGTGDERTPQLQPVTAKKPRQKNISYFLPS